MKAEKSMRVAINSSKEDCLPAACAKFSYSNVEEGLIYAFHIRKLWYSLTIAGIDGNGFSKRMGLFKLREIDSQADSEFQDVLVCLLLSKLHRTAVYPHAWRYIDCGELGFISSIVPSYERMQWPRTLAYRSQEHQLRLEIPCRRE
ncbi:hypothetical protein Tco_0108996 [Tanacetum coccineum]